MKKSKKSIKSTKPTLEHKRGSQARNQDCLDYLLDLHEPNEISSDQFFKMLDYSIFVKNI
jgi:hypothetical protein